MNTHDIELQPLPSPFGIVDPDGTEGMMHYTIRDLQDYAKAYARTAIEADRKRWGGLVDRGPWKVGVNSIDARVFLGSDDFTHDVRLYIDGDFADQGEKLDYAKSIADQLNTAPQPAEPVAVPNDEVDLEEVRRYLVDWGCLDHPGVRALLAHYTTTKEQP